MLKTPQMFIPLKFHEFQYVNFIEGVSGLIDLFDLMIFVLLLHHKDQTCKYPTVVSIINLSY